MSPLSYDDIDVLRVRYIEHVNCWASLASLLSLPVLEGESGSACHPYILLQYSAELEDLGLCAKS